MLRNIYTKEADNMYLEPQKYLYSLKPTLTNSAQESQPNEEQNSNYITQWEFASMRKWGGHGQQSQRLGYDPESQTSDTNKYTMPCAKRKHSSSLFKIL